MTTLPMFDLPQAAAPAVGEPTGRRGAKKKAKPDAITWTAYRPKTRVACDDCLADLVAAEGRGPLARAARYRRQQGDGDRLVCTNHMVLRRQLDGLDPISDADGKLR